MTAPNQQESKTPRTFAEWWASLDAWRRVNWSKTQMERSFEAGYAAALETICKVLCPFCRNTHDVATVNQHGLWVHYKNADEPTLCEANEVRRELARLKGERE